MRGRGADERERAVARRGGAAAEVDVAERQRARRAVRCELEEPVARSVVRADDDAAVRGEDAELHVAVEPARRGRARGCRRVRDEELRLRERLRVLGGVDQPFAVRRDRGRVAAGRVAIVRMLPFARSIATTERAR